jgi:hypothetical protein
MTRPPIDVESSSVDDLDLEKAAEFNDVTDELGFPREFVICPHCSAQSWRLPPHGSGPCPLVVQMAEQLGMRFDAERMQAIRMGVHMEESTKALREFLREHFEDEEDE